MRDFWTGIIALTVCLIFAGLQGCADSSSRTGDDKELDVDITVNNYAAGTVNINPGVGVTTTDGDVAQTTRDTANISPTTKAVMAEGQSQGTLADEGGSALLKGIKAVVEMATPSVAPKAVAVPGKEEARETTEQSQPAYQELPANVTVSKHFHHYFSLGDKDTIFNNGPTFMMCEDSPRWDACYLNTDGKIYKLQLHGNQDKNRDLWYFKGSGETGDGVVVCEKDGAYTAFEVEARGQSSVFSGDCGR